MIIVPELPTDPAALRAQIEALEVQREQLRGLGRLSAERGRQFARELSDLRQARAVALARIESEAR